LMLMFAPIVAHVPMFVHPKQLAQLTKIN